MYCSSCGVDSVEGLKYCKRCGANIAADAAQPRKLPVPLIITFLLIIGFVFALGMAVPSLNAGEFHGMGFNNRDVMIMGMAVLGLTLAVIAMLVWLLLRLVGVQQTSTTQRMLESAHREIERPQLSAPPQSVGSVTESTTRTLDQRKYDTPRSLG